MDNFSKEIRAYALKNALEFGKADADRVLPKLFQHGLDKKDIKSIMPLIQNEVSRINKLSQKERENEFEKLKNIVKERAEVERDLPELENAGSNMIFRLAPYPSGALHLGNAKTYMLNALYAEKYKAKVVLVMDDTIGSEEKSIAPEAYQLIEDAFQILGFRYEKPVVYKSDRLEIYYKYALELIGMGKAYVCHCSQKVLHENRINSKECECRNLPLKEQLKRWEKMFRAKPGELVLRLKTSMQHPNPAFRDRVLFKISDKEHPRVGKKYRVWPTLEMSWAIDDHLLGITHIIRGNDLMIESDMERYIWDIFGWKHPTINHVGLIRIEGVGAKISKSKAQKEVRSGEFSGWDDPRTWSIQSLVRRGIEKEAIREFVKEIGLNKQDIVVPIDALYAINRKLIDGRAKRFSFVENPVKLAIKNAPILQKVEVPVHPDTPEIKREVQVSKDIFISKEDSMEFKEKEVRLLHLYNILIDRTGKRATYTSTENKPIQKINWVSLGVPVEILMPDGKVVKGLAESSIRGLSMGDLIQFERFGFCRLDSVGRRHFKFWFSHK